MNTTRTLSEQRATFIVEQKMLAVVHPARTTQFANLVSQAKGIAAYVFLDIQAMTVEKMSMSALKSTNAVNMLVVTIPLGPTTVHAERDIMETDTPARNLVKKV